jgi:hypothetical protein
MVLANEMGMLEIALDERSLNDLRANNSDSETANLIPERSFKIGTD